MATEPKDEAAGETPRLRGEDEAGARSGRFDLAGLVIAVALFGLAWVIVNDAWGYPVRRSYAQFGPEIVPYIVAAGLAVMAGLTVVMALRGDFEIRERLNWTGLALVTVGIVLQIALLYGGAGFVIASTALFACAAHGFGQRTPLLNIVIGGIMSLLLFLLFRYGLGLALPSGPLERVIDLALR